MEPNTSFIEHRSRSPGCGIVSQQLAMKLPYPSEGHSLTTLQPSLVSWWAWFNPKTATPEFGPTDYPDMILDSGQQVKLPWPFIAGEGGFRRLVIDPAPTNSRRLRFHLPVEDEVVDFEIDNPAYRK